MFKMTTKLPKNVSLLAVMGSGGHTKEMISILEGVGSHYTPRCYVVAETDVISQQKVEEFESHKFQRSSKDKYSIRTIPRSREVKQSWMTTVMTTLYAVIMAFPLVFQVRPDVILCNGPGTCVPICIAGFVLKLLTFGKVKIIYIESICRVETLSLSAWLLYYVVDHMIVQWPSLQEKHPKTTYIGKLV